MSSGDDNETVHLRRRAPLPGRAPDEPPPRDRRRTAAVVVVAAVLVSLGAGYGVATLLGGSGDGDRDRAGDATATLARTATSPAPARPAVKRTPAGTVSAPASPSSASSPVDFDAPIPAGWTEREFAVQKAGYLQSRWDDPADARSYVLINWIDGDQEGPAAAAVRLRATVAGRPDYKEVRFGPTRGKGWIWVYTLRDEQGRRAARVDLLSRHCGVLFAVLGSTSPTRFAQLQRTFITVSEGIRVKRRPCRQPAELTPESGPRGG